MADTRQQILSGISMFCFVKILRQPCTEANRHVRKDLAS